MIRIRSRRKRASARGSGKNGGSVKSFSRFAREPPLDTPCTDHFDSLCSLSTSTDISGSGAWHSGNGSLRQAKAEQGEEIRMWAYLMIRIRSRISRKSVRASVSVRNSLDARVQ